MQVTRNTEEREAMPNLARPGSSRTLRILREALVETAG